jgi:hypothetical protein
MLNSFMISLEWFMCTGFCKYLYIGRALKISLLGTLPSTGDTLSGLDTTSNGATTLVLRRLNSLSLSPWPINNKPCVENPMAVENPLQS